RTRTLKVDVHPVSGSHRHGDQRSVEAGTMSGVEAESGTRQRVSHTKPKPTRKRLHSPVDRQRSEFLRRCRARIDPAELGLPRSRIKRSEGLRREDVESLFGVSACWCARMEHGRYMRVSHEVLERLSDRHRLS